MVLADPERKIADAVAGRRISMPARVRAIRAVELEALAEVVRLHMCLELLRHVATDEHDTARGIAGIQRGERPVDDVYPIDLLRRDHSPSRRRAEAVVQ